MRYSVDKWAELLIYEQHICHSWLKSRLPLVAQQ